MRWPRGPRRYDLAILVELARLRARHYRLHLDGVRAGDATPCWWRSATRGSYGGGMRICPTPTRPTGCSTWSWAGRSSRLTLVRLKPRIYAGTHVNHPLVSTYRARADRASAADGITAYADGERASTCRSPSRSPRRLRLSPSPSVDLDLSR